MFYLFLPRILLISKLDFPNTSFREILSEKLVKTSRKVIGIKPRKQRKFFEKFQAVFRKKKFKIAEKPQFYIQLN